MVKKKMQKPVKIFLGSWEIALYHLHGQPGVAIPPKRRSSGPRPDWNTENTIKSAFSMRLTQKTVRSGPEAEKHMLYSIRWGRKSYIPLIFEL
jgi:hypothetical protein